MSQPATLAAFDIDASGVATPVSGPLDARPETGWRWLHFDLSTDGLETWLATQLPPLVVAALLAAETRPRCDVLEDGLLLFMRGVNLNPDAMPEDMVSLRMWITTDRVITLRKRRLMAVEALRLAAADGTAPRTPGLFAARLADELARRIETVSLTYEDQVDSLEEAMTDGEEVNARDCLLLRQKLIKLRRFIGPQREALEDLAEETELLSRSEAEHTRETANRAARTVEAIDAARERLIVLQDHIDAQTAMKLGRNGYILSVMAAIFLPLGFLTGLFGVNVGGMPGLDSSAAFPVLCLVSILCGLALYLYFRWRNWL